MKIALFISGGGTTMEAIIKACKDNTLQNIIPVLVVASKSNILGIKKALDLGIQKEDVVVLNRRSFTTEEDFGQAILSLCKERDVDFIGQYGWLVKTPKNLCEAYKGRIINQHPGPLDNGRPDFGGSGMYGLRVHQARIEFVRRTNRDFWTEATAHYVTSHFDEGKIIKRERVPIFIDDTAEILQARVLPIEHKVQIEALEDFSLGRVEEFYREEPLVCEGEEGILEKCKELAIKMYPNG
ncbi:hypothetical protein CO033_03290 [Candidatus Nomurabacteria bacterium CG_4_9_14_0_2_um_filter_32_10]|uniref:phosphoribosylglycinamide formyltransferase 1 n=3 Tax=Candidatus Nomuraibacteriota TaxID=1752729 RepID=A0A2H0CH92_9BACT|nr:MAG: hypothetical protein COW91_00270 [Candidatus Nomurabacteria bacterium CG22_combo_CG10-13_8_21_14_all_32_8]PIZ86180.1 MAG: hypothetical protein COX94_00865 [Candidatus Nomurabacteria bacterium CG_4_10_14_0_2_um_filter_33_9]PJC49100.1 MAG: hypothetical protein CO033_03290 [Candidatus Nomurabacteria bacterium CG_4_9_14_0_2_um_filter_32_10]